MCLVLEKVYFLIILHVCIEFVGTQCGFFPLCIAKISNFLPIFCHFANFLPIVCVYIFALYVLGFCI